ncbi:MAG TPA: hypothetical protein VMF89_36375 [Polyangiales bacterium]|nr:hypothetical protein [Polyangiales bacterium]
MKHGQLWALTAFGISSVINPGYFAGCAASVEEPQYQYGADEMAQLVLAASSSYELQIDGVLHRVDIDIEPARAPVETASRTGSAFALRAQACGERKLVATAHACVSSSTMEASGKLTLLRASAGDSFEEVASDVAVRGTLRVSSLTLTSGNFQLTYDGGQIELLSRDGKTFELSGHDLALLAAQD